MIAPKNQNRNQRNPQRKKTPAAASGTGFLPFKLSVGGFFANLKTDLTKEVTKEVGKIFKTPIQAFGGLFAIITSVITAIKYVLQSAPSADVAPQSALLSVFPARVLAFMIIAGSIAWSISQLGIWMTARSNETLRLGAHLVTAFGALFMAACIDWIFASDIQKSPFVVLLFSIIGVTFAIFLAKTNFRQTLEPDPEIIAVRAGLLLNFALVATGLVIFVQLTGLSR